VYVWGRVGGLGEGMCEKEKEREGKVCKSFGSCND